MENLFGEKIEKEVWEEPVDNSDWDKMRLLAYGIRKHIRKYMGLIPHSITTHVVSPCSEASHYFPIHHYIVMQIEGTSVFEVGIKENLK